MTLSVLLRLSLEAVAVMALALEAVDFRKQRRIMRAASWFLNEYGLNDVQCSFDVMTVENNEARYYFNCYGGI